MLFAREILTMRTCRPRWLVSKGRDAEALQTLAELRQLTTTDTRIQQEWFDIRAEVAFHRETSALRHPELQNRTLISRVKLEIVSWTDCFRRGCWRRTHVGVGIMFMQQYVIFCSGILHIALRTLGLFLCTATRTSSSLVYLLTCQQVCGH